MNEVFRQEKKFLITQKQLYELSFELMHVMQEDPHNCTDGYPIRSLYFDSLDDRDYQEKEDGVELRRKIRLRNYGPATPFAMLEMKQKQGAVQKKRSLKMERDDAERLIRRDYGVLRKYSEPFGRMLRRHADVLLSSAGSSGIQTQGFCCEGKQNPRHL